MEVLEFNGVPYITDREDTDQMNDIWGGEEWWGNPALRYTQGECHALALAICMERPGWTLAAWEDFDHVLALSPDGVAVDISGTYEGLDERYGMVIDPVDWSDLAGYIGQGYSHPTIDDFTRRCAREVLAENGL